MEIISGYVEVHVFRRMTEGIEYLMLRRAEDEKVYPGLWQVVTGKIEKAEKAYNAALREVLEETGFVPVRFWAAPKVNQFYSAAQDSIYIVPVFAAEIDGSVKVTLCEEHCEYKWMKPSDARELLPWEEQRKAMDLITAYIMKLPHYLDLVEINMK